MTEPSQSGVDWIFVYEEYMPRVYKFFRYRVRDPILAQDLTAITFEKAWRMRRSYRSDLSGISTWLLTIARNTASDHFRTQRSEDDLGDDRPEGTTSRPVEDYVLQEDNLTTLSGLMDDLTSRERELIALKYGAGLTNRAIAELTGLTESNVGTTLSRIVHLLRARWDVLIYER